MRNNKFTGNKILSLRALVAIFLVVTISLPVFGQVIENPGTPAAKNAGRQIKITQLLRITDTGSNFYFKSPYRLKITPDGTIFIADEKQLLKFTPKGEFVANFQKVGVGPGEYNFLKDFKVLPDRLIITAYQPPKVIILDLSGNLIKEMRLNEILGFTRVLEIFADKYYYINAVPDPNKNGLQVFHQKLWASNFADQKTDLKLDFPVNWMVNRRKTKDGSLVVSMQVIDHFCFASENEHSLYLSHTPAYLIKQVDPAAGKILRQFNRKYKPIPFIPVEQSAQGFQKENFSAVTGLCIYKGKLWVFTSSLDKEKGVLVDLFSKEGKYLDNFYVPLPGIKRPDTLEQRTFTITGDDLYIVELDEEETPSIAKYKIEM